MARFLLGVFLFAEALTGQAVFARDYNVDARANCTIGDGSEERPYCSIQEAIDAASADGEGEIDVAPGVYREQIRLRPGVSLEGGDDGDVTVEYAPRPSDEPFVVLGTEGAELKGFTIRSPDGFTGAVILLLADEIRVKLEDIVFDGAFNPASIGVVIRGPDSSESEIKQCTFMRVGVGVDAADTGARITRNLFTEIVRDAIYVHPPEGGLSPFLLPEIGTDDALDLSGFNRFRDVGGFDGSNDDDDDDKGKAIAKGNAYVLRNTTGETLFAQLNDWNVFSSAEIAGRLTTLPPDGPPAAAKQIEGFVYEPFIGKSLFPGSIFVRIEDAVTGEVIGNARPELLFAGQPTGIAADFDEASGLYSFVFLNPETYTVRAAADGYAPKSVVVLVGPGGIEARELQLNRVNGGSNAPVFSGFAPASPSSNRQPEVSGTTIPNGVVQVYIDGIATSTVRADASGAFSARIGPLAPGPHQILFALNGDLNNSSPVAVYEVTNTDDGAGPLLAITPLRLDFGFAEVGVRVQRFITLANPGTASLTGSVTADAPFRIDSHDEFTLEPGAELEVIVSFLPIASASYEQRIQFNGADPVEVVLIGVGAEQRAPRGDAGGCAASSGSIASNAAEFLMPLLASALLLAYSARRRRKSVARQT